MSISNKPDWWNGKNTINWNRTKQTLNIWESQTCDKMQNTPLSFNRYRTKNYILCPINIELEAETSSMCNVKKMVDVRK